VVKFKKARRSIQIYLFEINLDLGKNF